jgi:adenylosuccinate synthase
LDNFSFEEDITAWEEEFFDALEFLKQLNIVNGEYFINKQVVEGKRILAEGAQGSMLDIDFGTFPFVTSSSTISAGVCSGLGVSPQKIRDVIGITKAYCTRVGGGPFPTELDNEIGEQLRQTGNEYGSTTGRPRRCGWIDLVALRFACMINGVTKIVMTKADVLDKFEELKLCISYGINGKEISEIPFQMTRLNIKPTYKNFPGWNKPTTNAKLFPDLPEKMKNYVEFINQYLGVSIQFISNGPGRDQIVSIN